MEIKYLAAAIAVLAGAVSAIADGIICMKAVDGIARNPEVYSKVRTTMILGCALSETTAIYALVIAILILFI